MQEETREEVGGAEGGVVGGWLWRVFWAVGGGGRCVCEAGGAAGTRH